VKAAISRRVGVVVAAAAGLTGKRFGLLVASSLVATSAVVTGALTGAGDSDALASLLARQLAANDAPVAPASPPAPPSGGGPTAPSGGAAGSAPSSPGAVEGPSPPAPLEEPATPATRPEAGPVKHVFLISLASPGYEAAFGAQSQMPYLATTLRPQGELLSGYTLLSEGALANGIAAISGQPPNAATDAGCPSFGDVSPPAADARGVVRGTGCVYPVETLTIADQLTPARLSWRAYVEGMADSTGKPAKCVHPDPGEAPSGGPGGYAATQNPFVYFHSLLDLGDCAANDVPIDGLAADLKKADKTPTYSFIAPTPCDAGFAGQCAPGALEGGAAADAFLEEWAPKILQSPAYAEGGLLVVAFSGMDPGVAEAADEPLRTGALLLSPLLAPGGTDTAPYDPYSLLRSTEDLFGLQPLALAAGAKVKSFASGLLAGSGGD
jgi:Phosphoesterase family